MSIQIKQVKIILSTIINNIELTTVWLGPSDNIRYASILYPSRIINKEEGNILREQAINIFTNKIEKLKKVLND